MIKMRVETFDTPSPARYLRCHNFIMLLKHSDEWLTRQEFATLRGQALAGDIEGAYKGFDKLMSGRGRARR